ncbi:hypothetical protein [Chryseobacterium sp. GP-SGM7]|uniref:hypothetical protein n=1 Tax=Chryseobacterium sp. GP-SGM7 TaxID=3411323 RepID=UPI003B92F757
MRNIILLYSSVILLTTFSCKYENKETAKPLGSTQQTSESETIKIPVAEKKFKDIDWLEFSNLVPIEIKDVKNKDVFKKYGIEFTGNCYACDLAEFKFNKKNFDLVSLCEKNDFHRYKEFKYENSENSLKIITSDATFIFTKVENDPIYKLSIEGKKPQLKNKRISEYYVPQRLIEKFEEHDCGDFGG